MVSTRNTTASNQNNNQQDTQPRRQYINHLRGPGGSYEKPSQKIRDLAIQYCDRKDNMSISKAAQQLGVKRSTLSSHVNIYRQEGRNEPKKRGRRKGNNINLNDSHEEFLKNTLDEDSTQTINTLREKLINNFPELAEQNISTSGVWRFLVERIGFTLTGVKAVEEKRNGPATINARYNYINKLLHKGIAYNTNYIFVDEAGFNANLVRRYGWLKKGTRPVVTTQGKRAIN